MAPACRAGVTLFQMLISPLAIVALSSLCVPFGPRLDLDDIYPTLAGVHHAPAAPRRSGAGHVRARAGRDLGLGWHLPPGFTGSWAQDCNSPDRIQ
mgnify:CR=1 FL=1